MGIENTSQLSPVSCLLSSRPSSLVPKLRSDRATAFQFMRAARKIAPLVVLVLQSLEFRAQCLLGQSCQGEMDWMSSQMKCRVPRLLQYVDRQVEGRANFRRRRGWIIRHVFRLVSFRNIQSDDRDTVGNAHLWRSAASQWTACTELAERHGGRSLQRAS